MTGIIYCIEDKGTQLGDLLLSHGDKSGYPSFLNSVNHGDKSLGAAECTPSPRFSQWFMSKGGVDPPVESQGSEWIPFLSKLLLP